MKKLVSILLVIVLVLGAVVTVSANDSYPVQEELVYQFEDKFVERYCATYDQIYGHYDYDELYYHYDENGQIDWTLIEQCSYNSPPWNYHTIHKDRILMYGDFSPFTFKYGVYDAVEDEFYDIFSKDFDFSKYEGLEEIFDSIEPGYPIGDADFDGELSVLDATFIQRALARLSEFHYRDEINATAWHIGSLKYMSDFDRDGKRSIIDATAIQRKLAQLDIEPEEPTQDVTVVPTVDPTEISTTPEPPVSGTENPNEIHLYFPDPVDSVYCKGNVYSEYMGEDGNVYCRILDMDFNTIGDSDLYSQEHLAEIVVQEKNKIGVYYYPFLKGLALEPGAYMYDFYTTEKSLIFRSYLYID